MQTHRSPPGLGVRVESWVVAGTGVSVAWHLFIELVLGPNLDRYGD